MKNVGIAIGLLILIIAAYFSFRYYQNRYPSHEETLVTDENLTGADDLTAPPLDQPQADLEDGGQEEIAGDLGPLPDLQTSDQYLRDTLAANVLVERLLGDTEEMVRRFITATYLIGSGKNPFKQISFLQPQTAFAVEKREGRTYLSAANYKRYDSAIEAFESLDDTRAIQLYRHIKPLLDQAHDELGSGETRSQTASKALEAIMSFRPPREAPELIGNQGVYIFADEELENLPPIQKALIRVGPDHTARIQRKLALLRSKLGDSPL